MLSPIIIQRMAPPKTSEAVTGAASAMIVFTDCSVMYDLPRSLSITSRSRNFSY